MEKILIILIVLLLLVVIVLVGITLKGKKKKKEKIESITFDESSEKIEEKKEEVEEKKIEPIIELEEKPTSDLEQTREQTEVIEIISSMQENAKNLTDKVVDYEDEQEENAIISYTELLNAVKSKKEVQEEIKFEVKEEDDSKKFHSSDPISPLGRINSVSDDSYKSTVKPSDMQDEDFLKSLKDFRNNL